ncbi:AMP-binding protein [Streptomyces sp. XD-27]|uniref:AMP-binding protein n=1 Tax=Streptomyces sp. XD-27 TaxID=3062779 RepID=UPI0026F419A3|nr:AMP-binding protein [Streptomyces sp. XD-27]WKX70196.1 AMP-binding protein [Streptomyces sp. XD-27]
MTEQTFVSYAELILDQLADDPGRTVLTTDDGQRIPAGELHDSVLRMAAEMADRGIERGSTVAVFTGNRPEGLSARYAANLLGARVAFLYEGMAPATLATIVESIEADLLLVDPDAGEAGDALVDRLRNRGEGAADRPAAPAVLSFGPSPLAEDLTACAARHPVRRSPGAARPEDDWSIRFTGGTTGIPKGIRMAHGPYRDLCLRAADRDAPPRLLVCTSIAHMAGILADATLLAGGQVVLRRAFDPGDVLTAVERERITDVFLLPPLLYRVLDALDQDGPAARTDTSSLRRLIYAGCPASPTRLRQAAGMLGPVLHGWYGQSEAGWISEALPHEHAVTGHAGQITVGRAIPGVEIAVRDEDGRDLPLGEVGEVYVRSAQAMSGYWKRPELTAQVLRADGWLRTGDAGYLDEAGYLFLVDRLKEMIIVVGGHVYPTELEDVLLTHPAVAHCAVFGVRRSDESEEVHAAVVPAPGHRLDDELTKDIGAFVTARMGAMYAPAALHAVDSIPLTDVGKPDKKLLRARAGTGAGAVR